MFKKHQKYSKYLDYLAVRQQTILYNLEAFYKTQKKLEKANIKAMNFQAKTIQKQTEKAIFKIRRKYTKEFSEVRVQTEKEGKDAIIRELESEVKALKVVLMKEMRGSQYNSLDY